MKPTARRSLLALALAAFTLAATSDVRAFEARETIEMSQGIRVAIDGRGELRITLGETPLFAAAQVLVYGEGPNARVSRFAERGTIRSSDATTLADQEEVGLHRTRLVSRVHSWRYFHVDDIVFLDSFLESDSPDAVIPARPGIRVTLPAPSPWVERKIRSHRGEGKGRSREALVARAVHDLEDGSRVHVGLLRLDAMPAEQAIDSATRVWANRGGAVWPLAVIAARSERSLLHLAGLARLTYDPSDGEDGAVDHWRVPTLCARCQASELRRVEIEVSEAEGNLVVEARIREEDGHKQIVLENLIVDGVALGSSFEGAGRAGRSRFSLPPGDARVERLLQALRDETATVQAWTTCNEPVIAQSVDLRVAPTLYPTTALEEAGYETEELPHYLSPHLVSAFPNPFEDVTTVEITIPSRIGDAFELEGGLAQRVNPDDPPPFGDHPTVSVKVFNVSGQLVRVLEQGDFGPGMISVTWDGQDLRGQTVASGAYYVHVRMGDWSVTQRVLRLGS